MCKVIRDAQGFRLYTKCVFSENSTGRYIPIMWKMNQHGKLKKGEDKVRKNTSGYERPHKGNPQQKEKVVTQIPSQVEFKAKILNGTKLGISS